MKRKTLKAREVMSRNLVSVGTETKVFEIARLLAQNRIGGVPVVDNNGRLLGVVTEGDLFPKEKPYPFSLEKGPALLGQWFDTPHLQEAYGEVRNLTAADVMVRNVWAVDVESDVEEVAVAMMERKSDRVPVLQDDRVVGIITRLDLIHHMMLEGV